MLHIPISRWGEPYQSMETDRVVHFQTGEVLAEVSRANAALVERDMRHARRAREVLREIPIRELLAMLKKAADLYTRAELPLGNGSQTPEQFVRMQSATTGMPEHMCRFNMEKNHFVLTNMDKILDSLTRGLDLEILCRGYGVESRGVPISFQCQSPVLGLVLPSNSPGVHTLWLPIIPLQIGLVLKPGPQEPWTPYRMTQAFIEAGVPKQAMAIYPGLGDVGAAVVNACPRSLIFGSSQTVEQYKGNPRVQVHGPGFSKILFGDDTVDEWEKYLDLMVDSVLVNSGRGCINCSGIWVSRHGRRIAQALAERMGPIEPKPPDDPQAQLAAFTVSGQAEAIYADIARDLAQPGVEDMTARFGPRLVKQERCAYLRPMVVFCSSPDANIAKKEYMFPFVTVVECPQEKMLEKIGSTLVCTAITADAKFQRALADAPHIDRLNIGPIPTIKLNWLQPHEGNIVDFLFRARAFQFDKDWIRI
ncbi:MAG: aldehyde dehydrogenase family protein [Gemmatales bacterium]|nr:aldehyde dehydrogenase family protein [Gemmatales bacterium]MCS7160767.1 aldehyde dehydrogenase family protein [Gemmatales bacterium]MDW8175968.1 aldehyde dehydrogenase family protein [Gemmatales bacterium]MDW8222339.1 aldehyde dehydrogenase family protein [Gemmatales bacterium]